MKRPNWKKKKYIKHKIESLQHIERADIEFSRGDDVTFKPYQHSYPARVLEVRQDPITGEIEYRLGSRPGSEISVKSLTSGKSILESKYYEEYDPNIHEKGE